MQNTERQGHLTKDNLRLVSEDDKETQILASQLFVSLEESQKDITILQQLLSILSFVIWKRRKS